MRKTVYKVFFAWEFDKEEKWLCKMAADGQALVAVSYFRYTFEECDPGEFTIRLELLNSYPTSTGSVDYIRFLEGTGAEYLGSVICWVYFRKKTEFGEFDLFSDNSSRITHLNRMLTLTSAIALPLVIAILSNVKLYIRYGETFNLFTSVVIFLFGGFAVFGFMQLLKKRNSLKKEQNLFE